MTVSAYIVDILKKYVDLVVDTNHVSDGSDQYGLFKSPSRDTKEFNDGSYEITEYYQFFARRSSVSRSERKEDDKWLEDMTYLLDDMSYAYEFPELDETRKVQKMEITGIPYPMEADDKEILYQMSLSITYLREREDF